MIVPTDYRVLLSYESVADYDPQFARAKKAGLVLPEDHEDMQRRMAGVDKGHIIAIGPTADFGFKVEIGDRVGIAKHSGKIVEDEFTQSKYLLVNDEDVLYVQRNG
jgi:co-chaperonin GroES (HSP10)